MSKTVIITPAMSGHGGTESVLKKVISQNPGRYFLFVISTEDGSWISETGISSPNLYVGKKGKIRKAVQLVKVLLRERPSMVISLDTKYIFFLAHLKRIFNLHFKIVSWIHYSIFNEPSVNTRWLKLADYHLAIAEGIANQLISIGVPSKKIFVIKNPIARQNRTIPASKSNHFVYIGRTYFRGQKNLAELLDGLSKVKEPWVLDVYGDGPEMEKCQNYASYLKINDNIRWHGYVHRPFSQIKDATALLLSSTYEGLPMVILEALSYGIPCISSNCPSGTVELISNGLNGYLYQSGNPTGLTTQIETLIRKGVMLSQDEIKASINEFYEDNYFRNYNKTLKEIEETND